MSGRRIARLLLVIAASLVAYAHATESNLLSFGGARNALDEVSDNLKASE